MATRRPTRKELSTLPGLELIRKQYPDLPLTHPKVIGYRAKLIRLAKGMSRRDVARASGLTLQQIREIEEEGKWE